MQSTIHVEVSIVLFQNGAIPPVENIRISDIDPDVFDIVHSWHHASASRPSIWIYVDSKISQILCVI